MSRWYRRRPVRRARLNLLMRWALAAALAVGSAGCAGVELHTRHINSVDPGYRLIQEPDAGYQVIGEYIGGARRTVRITMYELTDPTTVAALGAAHRRGVSVKVLLDKAYHGEAANARAYRAMRDDGIDVAWASNDVIYHQKSLTIDDAVSIVSTANLVRKFYLSSRDAMIVTTDRADVTAIAATFDADFDAALASAPPAATPGPHLIWSPNAKHAFLQHINAATTGLDLSTEEFTDRDVAKAIAAAARRRVTCRIVLPVSAAHSAAVRTAAGAGCSVRTLDENPSQLYMHEKALLTDTASLIIGSQNLSATSLTDNRELALTLSTAEAPDVVSAVHTTFDHDYAQALPAPSRAY